MLSERRNIVVIADETHRSQYDSIDRNLWLAIYVDHTRTN